MFRTEVNGQPRYARLEAPAGGRGERRARLLQHRHRPPGAEGDGRARPDRLAEHDNAVDR
jgi:hypothetical protein